MYLRTKFQVSSIIVTSFRQGVILQRVLDNGLSLSLVYNRGLTNREIVTLVTWSILCIIFKRVFHSACSYFGSITTIESRQHADCGLKKLLKIPAKIRHSFRYLAVSSLFLQIFFYNFEVKITRNI